MHPALPIAARRLSKYDVCIGVAIELLAQMDNKRDVSKRYELRIGTQRNVRTRNPDC